MSNREYWIWTEVFVHVHRGKDYCPHQKGTCEHCAWMEEVFGRPAPRTKRRKVLPSHRTGKLSRKQVREAVRKVRHSGE